MAGYEHRAATMRRLTMAILVLTEIAVGADVAMAEVFHSRESALRLAFGDGARIESRELFLSANEQAEASRRAGSTIESRLVQRYEGHRDAQVLGYAYFETHRVRTLPETLLIVIAPDGTVASVHVLAFHEPAAYLPHEGFLEQFGGRGLDAELSLRAGVQGIAGSTFTANAVTAAVRRVLAIHATARTKGGR